MFEQILVAIDVTSNENNVLDAAQDLADLTSGTVHLLHVAEQQVTTGEMLGEGLGVTGGADVDAREMALSDQAVARLTAAGVKADGQVIQITRGAQVDIARVILRRAQELDVDLIVLGESLHGRASRRFRGSVADEVVHHNPPCSVLAVP